MPCKCEPRACRSPQLHPGLKFLFTQSPAAPDSLFGNCVTPCTDASAANNFLPAGACSASVPGVPGARLALTGLCWNNLFARDDPGQYFAAVLVGATRPRA